MSTTGAATTPRVEPLDRIAEQLAAFAGEHYGGDAEVSRVRAMPGHAGLSFGFDVWQAGQHRDALVLRIPPKGVRRSGNTDVVRQAPLLRALHASGLPVPRVVWAGEEEHWFGVPFLMVERLSGETCFPWDPQPVWNRTGETIPELWRLGAQMLARVHRVDWERRLPDWEQARSAQSEIDRWRPVYRQAPEPAWVAAAEEARQLLLETLPEQVPTGLVHGDYQIGNLLFEGRALTGILDWELSCIGPHLLDIGWYLTFADPDSWHEEWGPVNPAPLAELQEIYEDGMGRSYPDLDWYRALAAYRMGAIACLNVKLHRRGHRRDPVWEKYALATPRLFAHARRLLLERRTSTRRPL
jgi:aminoglycoside phosphotransferase (APT) family kinase protein